jgi:hypothetical protein
MDAIFELMTTFRMIRWPVEIRCYLGLTPAAAQVRFGRSNPFPLEAIVENYAEVAEALHGTPFAWMMADEQPA